MSAMFLSKILMTGNCVVRDPDSEEYTRQVAGRGLRGSEAVWYDTRLCIF